MRLLHTLRALDFPDWRIVSGAIYQTVWNRLTHRPYDYGIRDYDIAYYHTDLSYEAEDAVIQRIKAALPDVLAQRVEIRNQARVHLWYEARFGRPYLPLAHSDESLLRYPATTQAVAIHLEKNDDIVITEPFGLDDIFSLTVRPNSRCMPHPDYDAKAKILKARWPELVILPPHH